MGLQYMAVKPKKSGRIIDPYAHLKIEGVSFEMIGIIISEPISVKGDSGAPALDASDRLVGYVIGGPIDNEYTYIMPFHKTVSIMDYKII